jgi:hypothetical protein
MSYNEIKRIKDILLGLKKRRAKPSEYPLLVFEWNVDYIAELKKGVDLLKISNNTEAWMIKISADRRRDITRGRRYLDSVGRELIGLGIMPETHSGYTYIVSRRVGRAVYNAVTDGTSARKIVPAVAHLLGADMAAIRDEFGEVGVANRSLLETKLTTEEENYCQLRYSLSGSVGKLSGEHIARATEYYKKFEQGQFANAEKIVAEANPLLMADVQQEIRQGRSVIEALYANARRLEDKIEKEVDEYAPTIILPSDPYLPNITIVNTGSDNVRAYLIDQTLPEGHVARGSPWQILEAYVHLPSITSPIEAEKMQSVTKPLIAVLEKAYKKQGWNYRPLISKVIQHYADCKNAKQRAQNLPEFIKNKKREIELGANNGDAGSEGSLN